VPRNSILNESIADREISEFLKNIFVFVCFLMYYTVIFSGIYMGCLKVFVKGNHGRTSPLPSLPVSLLASGV